MTIEMTTTAIPVERRFPLDLRASIGSIRSLYETAKRSRWDPNDIAWSQFDVGALSPAAREAGQRVWSRRAWLEYTGLTATPALLIRFCLESGRESDPKYFLTVRNTEEAWHIECFHRYAKLLGGYRERPDDPRWEPVLNRRLYRDVLDAAQSLDGYVAVHCAVEAELEQALYERHAANAREPVAAAILARVVAAKQRHAAFGWLYLAERAAKADAAARADIDRQVAAWVEHVALAGYHVPTLASGLPIETEEADRALAAEAGLGSATSAQEHEALRASLQAARSRLQALGLTLPLFRHARLGEV